MAKRHRRMGRERPHAECAPALLPLFSGHPGVEVSGDAGKGEAWRGLLLGTVAAGAVLLGYGRRVYAGPGPCPVVGTTMTCTGDHSAGIATSNPITILNVNNLTVDITIPPDAVPGFRDLVLMTCGSPVVLVNAFEVVCSPPADFNCDTFVDGLDYVAFEACSSGAEVPVTAGCEHMDLDGDGDADGDDFGKFQKCFKGSAEPQTDANCGN